MNNYIVMHKKEYSESDIMDMVNSSHVVRYYTPQTYWEPGEDYVDYIPVLDEDFNKVVQIAELHYNDKNDEDPYEAIIDNTTYSFNKKEEWIEILEKVGWVFFGDFNFEDSKEYAEYDIKEWIDEIAEQKAWEYIENLKYGDY